MHRMSISWGSEWLRRDIKTSYLRWQLRERIRKPCCGWCVTFMGKMKGKRRTGNQYLQSTHFHPPEPPSLAGSQCVLLGTGGKRNHDYRCN